MRQFGRRAARRRSAGAPAIRIIRKTDGGAVPFWSKSAAKTASPAPWSTPAPDLREQLIGANADWLDGVLITHEHADHTHGIDDLRGFFLRQRHALDLYLDEPTSRVMFHRFNYCFVTPPGSNYPPIASEHRITPGHEVTIKGRGGAIAALPFLQNHGDIDSLGFRFGNLAYSSDLVDIPDASLPALADLDVWIIDALRYRPHPSHFSVDQALEWIERMRAQTRDPDQPAFRSRLRRIVRRGCRAMSCQHMTGCRSIFDLPKIFNKMLQF